MSKHRVQHHWMAVALLATAISLSSCQNADRLTTTNPVKPIELASLDKLITAKTFNGLVVAFASWCPPCREELPVLAKLYRDYHARGIQILAISLDADGPKTAQPLIDELKIPFPVYWVGQGAIHQYKIAGVPTLLVVKGGQIIEKKPGQQSHGMLVEIIKKILSG